MNELDNLGVLPQPTVDRPLRGLTVLVVEDSRFACEAIRLLCLRSEARIRRADCLSSARRHLRVYRPTVAIIDLGLPDGSGTDLITELAMAGSRIPAILGTSGDDSAKDQVLAAGADGFLPKPIPSLAAFQHQILSLLPTVHLADNPMPVSEEQVQPDQLAFQDDMVHIAEILESGDDGGTIDYVGKFLVGVARIAHDRPLGEAADTLIEMRRNGQPTESQIARLSGMVQERLSAPMSFHRSRKAPPRRNADEFVENAAKSEAGAGCKPRNRPADSENQSNVIGAWDHRRRVSFR